MVLTSKTGEIFGTLPGRPVNDPTWDGVMRGVVAAIERAKRRLKFGKKQDRRGTFRTIASGVSYGGGQRVSSGYMLSTVALT